MTQWSPVWRVSIDGYTVTDVTLSNLVITSGRTDIFNQAQAGYCSVTLINLDNSLYNFGINTQLTIEVQNSTGTHIPIFGGWITDYSTSVNSAGSLGATTSISIIALGALSKLQKIITLGVLTADFEGNQIYDLLDGFLYGSWTNVSASQTWASYDPTITWANAENQGIGEIDMPGAYEMISRSASNTNLYDLVAQIATSAFGYIYEDANGNIGYADTTHRQDYLAANGYVELDANNAQWQGISVASKIGDVRNKLILAYGNSGSSSLTTENLTSQATYGVYAQTATSNIKKTADATSLSQRYIDLRSIPYEKFQSITYQLSNPEIDDSDRDNLIGIFMGMPVQVSNLPINIAAGQFQGYVEGWTFRAGYNNLSVTFNASPTAFNQVAVNWDQVSGSEHWNTLSGTLTWQNAIGAVA